MDHVVSREFFLVVDRANLPQVPACKRCNGLKSAVQTEMLACLPIGSRLPDADTYRRDYIRPRLAKNERLSREIGLGQPPVEIKVNGIMQPMNLLTINSKLLHELHVWTARGLHAHHSIERVPAHYEPIVRMYAPDDEAAAFAGMQCVFPDRRLHVSANLGRGTFTYEGARSPHVAGVSIWRFRWHGGVTLYGKGAPPEGISATWVSLWPPEAELDCLEAEEARGHRR